MVGRFRSVGLLLMQQLHMASRHVDPQLIFASIRSWLVLLKATACWVFLPYRTEAQVPLVGASGSMTSF